VLLIVHIVSSVGWLGVSLTMLTLGLAGEFGDSDRTVEGAYWAAHLFVNVLVIPLSLISLASGVLVGLVTHWGLVRHKWVLTKLVLTTVTTCLGIFLLRPGVAEAYHYSSHGDSVALRDAGRGLIGAGTVSTTTYLVITVISVIKPWGATRWARAAAGQGS
jgi:multisubunit Na+/H+ antiporter MnhG subunit